jgi:hypothetical protein
LLTLFSIDRYRSVPFLVIVNPQSGPGNDTWWPNEDYVRELPKLNAYPNVRTIGYVRSQYCERPVDDVYADIDAYAERSSTPGLGVNGIFIDETDNHYTEDVKQYLDDLDTHIKANDGFGGDRIVRDSC